MASSTSAANNLLSPNAALEQVTGGKPLQQQQQQQHQQQRRKSTLSGNGFFIDYSCTRRRSSAARGQQQQRDFANRNQFMNSYVSPARLQVADKSGGPSQQQQQHQQPETRLKQPSNVGGSRGSRASYSAASGSLPVFQQPRANSFLIPTLYAPAAMAGSRKTSIFDPAGHSIMAPHLAARRKSTMVTGGANMLAPVGLIEPSGVSNTMISVARKAAAKGARRTMKGELAQHVPVIGCSPTSIQASLSALEESKRYEKLLRRLKSHKERKEKRRRARNSNRSKGTSKDSEGFIIGPELVGEIDGNGSGRFIQSASAGLRRRSVKMMRDVASLLNKRKSIGARASGNFAEDNLDDLSVSSLSQLTDSSDRASLQISLDYYKDGCDEQDGPYQGCKNKYTHNQGYDNQTDRYQINNDDLFVDENTLVNFNDLASSGSELKGSRSRQSKGGENSANNNQVISRKRSFVRRAIKKLSASIATNASSGKQTTVSYNGASSVSPTATMVSQAKSADPKPRSMSVAGLNYHYYYHYLRQNSADAIDDLPIKGGGVGGGTNALADEHEYRVQLHINYSLARIEILNTSKKVTGKTEPNSPRERSLRNMPSFSQSTDCSLTISSTSSSFSSSLASAPIDDCDNGNNAAPAASNSSSIESAASSTTTSVSRAEMPVMAAGYRKELGKERSSLRRSSSATVADDERTSVEMDPCRLTVSASVSPPMSCKTRRRQQQVSSRRYPTSPIDRESSLRPPPESAKRKSTSGELISHLRNNLVAADGNTNNDNNSDENGRESSKVSDRRLASSANTPTSLTRQKNGDNGDGDSDEQELDDFERFKRSYRSYKPPLLLDVQNSMLNSCDKATFCDESNHDNKAGLRPTKSLRCRNSSGKSSFKLAKRVGSFIIRRTKSNLRENADISQPARLSPVNKGDTKATSGLSLNENITAASSGGKVKRNSVREAERDCGTQLKSEKTGSSQVHSNASNRHNRLNWQPGELYNEQQALLETASAQSNLSAFNDNNNNNISIINNNNDNNNNNNDKDKDNFEQRNASGCCNFHSRTNQETEVSSAGIGNNVEEHLKQNVIATIPPWSGRPSPCFLPSPTASGCGSSRQAIAQYDCCAQADARQARERQGFRARSQSSLINSGCLANELQMRPTADSNSMLRLPDYEFRRQSQQHNLQGQVPTGFTCKSRRCHSATFVQPSQHQDGSQASESLWQVWGSYNDIIITGAPSEDAHESGCIRDDCCIKSGGAQNEFVCQVCANLQLVPVNDRKVSEERLQQQQQQQQHVGDFDGESKQTRRAVDTQLAVSNLQDPAGFHKQYQDTRHGPTRARAHSSGSGSGNAQEAAAAVAHLRQQKLWQPTLATNRDSRSDISDRYRKDPANTCSDYYDQSDKPQLLVGSSKLDEHHLSSSVFDHESGIQSEPGLSSGGAISSVSTGGTSTLGTRNSPQDASISGIGYETVENINVRNMNDVGSRPSTSGQVFDDEQIKIDLLRKSTFTCMLVGARQTGKRSIVKCFVKLLNEFKLALEEYKKEKMLAKLMDFSERLQALSDQQEELRLQASSDQQLDRRPSGYEQGNKSNWKRARGNSWLSGSPVDRWFRLPSMGAIGGGSKRRLNSMVAFCGQPRLRVSQSGDNSNYQQEQQRRHTTIEHEGLLQSNLFEVRRDKLLTVDSERQIDSLNSTCNKSDFNINYQGNNRSRESVALQELNLHVPSKKLGGQDVNDECQNSSGDLASGYLRDGSSRANLGQSMQFLCPTPPTITDSRQATNRQSLRNQSIQINSRRKPIISLKELNKRRIKIKFNTRRRLSDRYTRMINSQQENLNPIQSSDMKFANGMNIHLAESDLPDSYMVVYSVNDRESFDYAKLMVSQLRSMKRRTPVPIFLVANKVDLERAKVIKSEEGRTLAEGFACKFMETSCTVGFNLDNLLAGLRTQLILKHHAAINSALRYGITTLPQVVTNQQERGVGQSKGTDNILLRFYRRYLMDNDNISYECDNFSKL